MKDIRPAIGTAIHCPTKEIAYKVFQLLEFSWSYNHENYSSEFCFGANGYCNKTAYIADGSTIISAEDFLRANSPNNIVYNYLIL